jgi:hypothetical protein
MEIGVKAWVKIHGGSGRDRRLFKNLGYGITLSYLIYLCLRQSSTNLCPLFCALILS